MILDNFLNFNTFSFYETSFLKHETSADATMFSGKIAQAAMF